MTYEMQAEDGAWDDGGVETMHAGYTGSGFVNTVNAGGAPNMDKMDITLNIPD